MDNAPIGFIANCISTFAVHPIDVIKIRFQAGSVTNELSIPSIIKEIKRESGPLGFYRGVTMNLCSYPAFWSAFMVTKEYMQDNIGQSEIGQQYITNVYAQKFIVAYSAGAVASTVSNPIFMIKTKLQTENRSLKNTVKLINRSGYGSYMKGLRSTLMNNSKLAFQFPMYDHIKEKTNHMGDLSTAIAGLVSKLTCTTLFYPFDLARTIQRNNNLLTSTSSVFSKLYKLHGVRGLYKGVMVNNTQSIPNFIIMMYVYEHLKVKWNEHHDS